MSIDAMRQALHTLEGWANHGEWVWPESALEQAKRNTTESITALRAAIEQAQEPVAWVGPSWLNPETRTWESESFAPGPIKGWIPLYTVPRQWQGLTGEEVAELTLEHVGYPVRLTGAIEAKLKEKNG